MKSTCPYHNTLDISFPESPHKEVRHITDALWKTVDNLTSYTEREKEYITYTNLIRDFYRNYQTWIENILINCYREEMSREIYIDELYNIFSIKFSYISRETDNPNYTRLEHGIWTALLILKSIFQNYPYIEYKDCMKYCDDMMKYTHIHELPTSIENKAEAYNEYIKEYVSEPGEYHWKWKLFCPIKYTKEWNEFFKKIVTAIYTYFPNQK